MHEVTEVAGVAERPCDLVIAAEGSVDDAAWALLSAPGAPPVVLLQSMPALRSGAFDTLAAGADAAAVAAAVDRAWRYRQACRERDDARADRDAVFGALRLLVDDAAHLVHDIRTPGAAIRQALRAVGHHLSADQDVLLSEFGDELERVEGVLRVVLRLVQPLPPAPAPASLAEVFAAVRATLGDAARGPGVPLALRLEPASLAVPGRTEDWVTALCGALQHARAGREDARLELVALGSPGRVCLEIRRCRDAGSPPRLPPRPDTGVGMAFCRRLVAELKGCLEMSATDVVGGLVCRIELPSP